MLPEFTYFIFTTIDVFITTDTKFTIKHKHFIKTHTSPIAGPKCVLVSKEGLINSIIMALTIQCVEERSRKRRQKFKKKKGYKLLIKSYCPNPIVSSPFAIYLLIIQKIPHKLCSQHCQRATIIVRHTS